MNIVSGLPTNVQRSSAVLRGSGLVAFPTETVYGLGADARKPEAVARIFAAKGRPLDHPLRRVAPRARAMAMCDRIPHGMDGKG